jgi:hypothetical protein
MHGQQNIQVKNVVKYEGYSESKYHLRISLTHPRDCQVYGDNAVSDGMVRKWFQMFSEGRENVHDEA